ncbi:MAG: hypothetical protein ABS36_00855 [Acidobacteria bacterium SCN 69-37]|nr:MAG: hypothetical protein ABS36_00855 [Acidobacteria bacterium SCN 69-37]
MSIRRVPAGSPRDERGGRLLGLADLAAGRYPGFLFGLPVGRQLPVFHFHESTVASIDPTLRYLAENGYRTVLSDALDRLVHDGVHPGPRRVLLCFDDALASLWLVVAPLLRRYGFQAVTYAVPGRMRDAETLRPTIDNGPVDAAAADSAENPFATWPELIALSNEGVIDVQSHSFTHAMIFVDRQVIDVVRPGYEREHFMNRPLVADAPARFLTPDRLGYPLFPCRSRFSDGRRFYHDASAAERLEAHVAAHGGAAFFERPDWQAQIRALTETIDGRFETDEERQTAITEEWIAARDVLEARLGRPVRHVCLPWGITGRHTREALQRLGVRTAFANRRAGRLAVAHGDDPFFLRRLESRHVRALPGRGRRAFRTLF